MKVSNTRLLMFCLTITFFLSGLFVNSALVPIRPLYFLLLLCTPIVILTIKEINFRLLVFFCVLLCINLVAGLLFDSVSMKGFMIIVLFYLGLETWFQIEKKINFNQLCHVYLSVCYCSSLLIFAQQLGSVSGVSFLYDYGYFINNYHVERVGIFVRANSFFSEPAGVVYFMGIGFVYSVLCLVNRSYMSQTEKFKYVLIALSFPLTFSSLGFLLILLTLTFIIFVKIRARTIFLVSIVFLFVYFLFLEFLGGFFERVNVIVDLLSNPKAATLNLSVWAIYSNLLVMIDSIQKNFPFGSGFGNHGIYYNMVYSDILSHYKMDDYKLNSQDAAGLLVRLFSEGGMIFGLFIIFFVVSSVKRAASLYRTYSCNENVCFYVSAVLSFTVILLRHGNYLSISTSFSIFILTYLWFKSKNEIAYNIAAK